MVKGASKYSFADGKLLRRFRNALGWITGRGAVIPEEKWDAQYFQGHWGFIAQEKERYRYLAEQICAIFQGLEPEQRIVWDLGCGEGWMLGELNAMLTDKALQGFCYRGWDLSAQALVLAQEHWSASDFASQDICIQWEQGDIAGLLGQLQNQISVEKSPAVVLFNESLYYLENPMGVWQSWGLWLHSLPGPRRWLLASMYDHPRTRVLRRQIRRENLARETPLGQWTILSQKIEA